MLEDDQSNRSTLRGSRQAQTYHHRNRRVLIPDGVMAVGLIVGAHGLTGEVRVELHTDYPERFAPGNTVLLGTELVETVIQSARPHKAFYLIRFTGVGNRTDAEALRGLWLFIRNEDAAELEDGTYWIHDIIGMKVQDTDGRLLGTVRTILGTGANDVYVVDPADGINQGQEVLIPAITEVIREVDLDDGVLLVELMPGLLDEAE